MRRLTIGRRSTGGGDGPPAALFLLPGNDDAAEKERRRSVRRKSMGTPFKDVANLHVSSSARTHEEISKMYAAVIKMSSENKINQKNAWTLPMIDHIATILDERDSARKGPNFQRASCALESSVKIYSIRVDDTHTTSYRVLESLSRTDSGVAADAEAASSKGVSRKLCVAATLETNMNNITVRKYDLDFDVDPLFHKMSKAFDEGGAKGLLLHNLRVANGCDLVFDSQDVVANGSHGEPMDGAPEGVTVDATHLRTCITSLCGRDGLHRISQLALCPALDGLYSALREFRGGSGGAPAARHVQREPERAALDLDRLDEDDVEDGADVPSGADDDDEFRLLQTAPLDVVPEALPAPGQAPTLAPLPFADLLGTAAPRLVTDSEYCFFDVDKLVKSKMWAGSMHWKYGRQHRTRGRPQDAAAVPVGMTRNTPPPDGRGKAKTSRPRKAKFSVDFYGPAPNPRVAFAAPPRSKAATLLPASASKVSPDTYLIPAGVTAFKVEELIRLMTCPGRAARPPQTVDSESAENTSTRVAVLSSAAHSNECALDETADCGCELDDTSGPGASGAPGVDLGTYSDDEVDAAGFAAAPSAPLDVTLDVDGMVRDTFAPVGMVTAARKVGRIDVKYAKQAKKVDVRDLKETMWRHVQAEGGEGGLGSESGAAPPLTFRTTVNTLSPCMPASVTVPFYFICLLHLANENNLSLENNADLSDFSIRLRQ